MLIDQRGRTHFIETGGEPFMAFDFLEAEALQLLGDESARALRGASAMAR